MALAADQQAMLQLLLERGQSYDDLASILGALQGLGGEPPPAPPPPDWMPMPRSRFLGELQNAQLARQGQMMPPPAWMQPYLWGGR